MGVRLTESYPRDALTSRTGLARTPDARLTRDTRRTFNPFSPQFSAKCQEHSGALVGIMERVSTIPYLVFHF